MALRVCLLNQCCYLKCRADGTLTVSCGNPLTIWVILIIGVNGSVNTVHYPHKFHPSSIQDRDIGWFLVGIKKLNSDNLIVSLSQFSGHL